MRLLLLVGCLLLACSQPGQPDLLLITVDTLRADHLGCYGYWGARTPNIDALAKEGVLYEQCQSAIPVTLPSHATMFTGRVPSRHGVRNNATYQLPESIPTLTEQLANAGYQTGAFVGALPLAQRFGLARGFDVYDDNLGEKRELFSLRERPAEEVLRAAMAWLREQDPSRPTFLWVHLFEPHSPYVPPAPFDQQFRDRPYDGEIAAVDAAVGRLLSSFDAARPGRPRVTAFTSDHGEGLGEHGEATHAIYLYQTTLRVPLILHAPGLWPAGERVAEAVGLVDLAPTLLEAVGVDWSILDADGVALTPGSAAPVRRPLYSESLYAMEAYRWSPMFALREGSRKVVRSNISRSFDLQDDPDELQDLGDDGEEWATALLGQLDRRVVATAAATQELDASRQPTPEEVEALAAMGYVGGMPEASGPRDDDLLLRLCTELPDPTERHGEFEQTREAEELIAAKSYDAAAALLEGVLRESPQNVWARMLYGQALGDAGKFREAIAAYEEASTLRSGWLEVQVNLARLHGRIGEVARASEYFGKALAIEPSNLPVRLEAASFLRDHERIEQGRLLLEAGLQSASSPGARAQLEGGLARLYFVAGQWDAGWASLGRARAAADDDGLRTLAALYLRAQGQRDQIIPLLMPVEDETGAEGLVYLAEALQVAGRVPEAVQRYERALSMEDANALAHNNLAWALAVDLGEAERALPHARRAVELDESSPDYRDTLIEVLLRAGRGEEAAQELQSALQRFPGNPSLEARGG